LAELGVSIVTCAIVILATSRLVGAEWDRMRCAHLAFEAAHARRIGLPVPHDPRAQVSVSKTPRSVVADARCGQARERAELPFLESGPWTD
jgi:hypothetical protein